MGQCGCCGTGTYRSCAARWLSDKHCVRRVIINHTLHAQTGVLYMHMYMYSPCATIAWASGRNLAPGRGGGRGCVMIAQMEREGLCAHAAPGILAPARGGPADSGTNKPHYAIVRKRMRRNRFLFISLRRSFCGGWVDVVAPVLV